MKEIELSEKEANVVNDNGQEIPHTQEFVDGGFTLDVSYKGKIYRLFYDHQTWFTGVGYEIIS